MFARSSKSVRMPLFYRLQQTLLFVILLAAVCSARRIHHSKRPLLRASARERVPDSYFVHFRKSVKMEQVHELVRYLQQRSSEAGNFSASVASIITMAGYGFSARMSQQALQYVLQHRAVEFVEEDKIVRAGSSPRYVYLSWGLDRIDQTSHHYDSTYKAPCNLTGKGVDVYIMDTGIHFSHDQFEGRALYPGCDLADVRSQEEHMMYNNLNLPLRMQPENMTGWDCVGHGTHVAGIAGGKDFGVAPGVNLFSIRVLSCNQTGSWNSIVEGIECVLAHTKNRSRPAVINLSLYGEKTRIVKRSIDELLRQNITVVTIAGNSPNHPRDACRVSPASLRGTITVGATTRQDHAWPMSNAGVCVDIFAPGENILSANKHCNSCTEFKTGTSMAAPYVTGAIALLLQRCPNMPPWKVKLHLQQHMALKNKLNMTNMPKRMRHTTPNLLLNLHHGMCSLHC